MNVHLKAQSQLPESILRSRQSPIGRSRDKEVSSALCWFDLVADKEIWNKCAVFDNGRISGMVCVGVKLR